MLARFKERQNRDISRWTRDNTDADIEDMARGGDGGPVGGGETIRSRFYGPDWSDRDFKDLLGELAENEVRLRIENLVRETEEQIRYIGHQGRPAGITEAEVRAAVVAALGRAR
jgi:hypothetical protein